MTEARSGVSSCPAMWVVGQVCGLQGLPEVTKGPGHDGVPALRGGSDEAQEDRPHGTFTAGGGS